MSLSSQLSLILRDLAADKDRVVLLAGASAIAACASAHNTRSVILTTPLPITQLYDLPQFDLAIISDLIDATDKTTVIQWLSRLRHCHTPHLLLMVPVPYPADWQLCDFLSLGMEKMAEDTHMQLFSYQIEYYRSKHDWLNSKYWAHPENYDKYRW